MNSLDRTETGTARPNLQGFLTVSIGLCLALAIAGVILAQEYGFPAMIAVPVVAAFCWQAFLYCVAVSETARTAVARALTPTRLAGALVAASVAPYVIYSAPTGVFSWTALIQLVLLCSCVAYPYVLFPVRERRFAWQDGVVICVLAYPMISGLSSLFRDIFMGFDPPANRLDSLGKLMLIPLGLFVFLGLRRLQGTGFRLFPSRSDWQPALASAGYGFPWLLLVGLLTGFLQWDPPIDNPLGALGSACGKLLGIYFTTALAEEFLLRGVVQNLMAASTGRPVLSQAISALLFGVVHLGRGAFPNLPHAASAAVLGWFCGRAYVRAGSVTAAMITHALAVAGQELFFR